MSRLGRCNRSTEGEERMKVKDVMTNKVRTMHAGNDLAAAESKPSVRGEPSERTAKSARHIHREFSEQHCKRQTSG